MNEILEKWRRECIKNLGIKSKLDDSVAEWWTGLSCFVKEEIVCDFLSVCSRARGLRIIQEYLERNHYYSALGQLLESLIAGRYYAPEIVEIARIYEKGGKIKKALELYQEGIEKCDPYRISVYDENTGGEVSATDYPEANQAQIEEAKKLVKECRKKVAELKKKLARCN